MNEFPKYVLAHQLKLKINQQFARGALEEFCDDFFGFDQLDPKCREKYFGRYDFDGDYDFVDSYELTNELLREISRLGGVYLFVVGVMAVKKHGKWRRLLKEDSS